jgi:hypothetical protein
MANGPEELCKKSKHSSKLLSMLTFSIKGGPKYFINVISALHLYHGFLLFCHEPLILSNNFFFNFSA